MSNSDPGFLDKVTDPGYLEDKAVQVVFPPYGVAKQIADDTGLTPKIDTAAKGAYRRFTSHGGLLGPESDDSAPADSQPQPDPNAPVREPSNTEIYHTPEEARAAYAKENAPASSASAGRGSFSVSAQGNPFENQLRQDYDEQIAGVEGEARARQDFASGKANALDQYANTAKDLAGQNANQAEQTYQQSLSHINELGQLASDYANAKIDPDKFWREKSPGSKIATVIGAMLAGIAGGPKGVQDYVNNMVNRSVAIQQQEIEQKGHAFYQGENLYQNFLKASGNEEEAQDKTRAALLDAAMTEVAKASTELRAPIEQQQMKQVIAAIKAQRDTVLTKLKASAGSAGGAGGAGAGWLQSDGKNLVAGLDGQTYFVPNSLISDDVSNAMTAYKRMLGLVKEGQAILAERQTINPLASPVQYYQNLQRGHDLDGFMNETFSKLAQGRGVPEGVLRSIREVVPAFGSPTASLQANRLPEAAQRIQQFGQDALTQANARPVDYTTGPGRGKHAGEIENYVRPASRKSQTPEAATVSGQQKYPGFRPGH